MKQNKKITRVIWSKPKYNGSPSSMPIHDRLIHSITNGIPFNSPNSTTETSLDWFGNFYILYHGGFPVAVGKKGCYPFMFRTPYRCSDFGSKQSRKIKYGDDYKNGQYCYYCTSGASRLADLRIWLSYKKGVVGRKLNEKTGRMNNIYQSCPQITVSTDSLIDPSSEFISDSAEYEARTRNLYEDSIKIIFGGSEEWDEYANSDKEDPNLLDPIDYHYQPCADVPLLDGPCAWYSVLDGKPIPEKLIPEILFKTLRHIYTEDDPELTTPFNRLSRSNPMKTAHPTVYIKNVVNSFSNLYSIFYLQKFVGIFNCTAVERDVSTKFCHPQSIRLTEGTISVIDILNSYHMAEDNFMKRKEISINSSTKPFMDFYSNFSKVVPVLDYLCSDKGLKKQNEEGLSEMEVYDVRYRIPAQEKFAITVPVDFGLTIKLNQTVMKFNFIDDFAKIVRVDDNGKDVETIDTENFVDWIRQHFTEVRKSTTFDFDEI